MRRILLTLGAALAITSLVANAGAQSQTDKTGRGGIAVAGQESQSLLTHPLTLGAVVAGAIGIAVAAATAESSPVFTTTTTTSTR